MGSAFWAQARKTASLLVMAALGAAFSLSVVTDISGSQSLRVQNKAQSDLLATLEGPALYIGRADMLGFLTGREDVHLALAPIGDPRPNEALYVQALEGGYRLFLNAPDAPEFAERSEQFDLIGQPFAARVPDLYEIGLAAP